MDRVDDDDDVATCCHVTVIDFVVVVTVSLCSGGEREHAHMGVGEPTRVVVVIHRRFGHKMGAGAARQSERIRRGKWSTTHRYAWVGPSASVRTMWG